MAETMPKADSETFKFGTIAPLIHDFSDFSIASRNEVRHGLIIVEAFQRMLCLHSTNTVVRQAIM